MNYRPYAASPRQPVKPAHSDLFTCTECKSTQTRTVSFDRRDLRKNLDAPVVSMKNLFRFNNETICRTCWER